MRASIRTRIKALEAGQWQRHDGTWVDIRAMHDSYLVNALLKALSEREPAGITSPLTAEVKRRKLEQFAMQVAQERMKK